MNPLLITGVMTVIEKIFGALDPTKAEEAKAKLLELQMQGQLKELDVLSDFIKAQSEVNKTEAGSGDPYASRWRPTIGYIFAAALGYQYLLEPLAKWGVALAGSTVVIPSVGLDEHLWELMFGMLGMAGWRTMDKVKGVAK